MGKKAILSYQSEVTTFTIPKTVETIGSYAFWYANLNSITITSNVSKIGINPFANANFELINLSSYFFFKNKLLMTKEIGVTSRTQVQNYINDGHLLVNGVAQKAN